MRVQAKIDYATKLATHLYPEMAFCLPYGCTLKQWRRKATKRIRHKPQRVNTMHPQLTTQPVYLYVGDSNTLSAAGHRIRVRGPSFTLLSVPNLQHLLGLRHAG